MFILMCMYMNFHTSRMKFHIRNGGVFYLCRRIVSRHSVEVQILYGAFYEEKVLECSTLGQRKILRGISDKILSLCETNESSAIMETNGYRLLLPEGTLDYFNISDVKESSSEIVIYLEEKNELPGEYSTVKVESKGFYDPVVVRDFPIRGKNLFLNIRRRRWILKDEGRYVSRNWKLVAEGSRMTHEFASFLKELY